MYVVVVDFLSSCGSPCDLFKRTKVACALTAEEIVRWTFSDNTLLAKPRDRGDSNWEPAIMALSHFLVTCVLLIFDCSRSPKNWKFMVCVWGF